MRRALLFVLLGVAIGAVVANKLCPEVGPPPQLAIWNGANNLDGAEKRFREPEASVLPELTKDVSPKSNAEKLRELAHKQAALKVLEREVSELAGEVETFGKVQLQIRFEEIEFHAFRNADAFKTWCEGMTPVELDAKGLAELEAHLGRLQRQKQAKMGCSPKFVTYSGGLATCLCGGEVPIKRVTPDGVVVEYRETGMRLDSMAELVGDDRAKIKLNFQHTAVDPASAVMVEGQVVPGFSVRGMNLVLDSKHGSTIACIVPIAQGPFTGLGSAVHTVTRGAEQIIQLAGWDDFEVALPDSLEPYNCGLLLITSQKVSDPR